MFMDEERNWRLKDVLSMGLIQVGATQLKMPSWGLMRQMKAHKAYRCENGLWHMFRFEDKERAAQMDADLTKSALPRKNMWRDAS